MNLEKVFKSYYPINQFRSSVLMDCIKQSRKIVREEKEARHNSLYRFDSRWIYV